MARRNVLFIVIDQLRADLLFGEMSRIAHLPNIRALMAEAATFTRHFSVVNPCGPSRSSILTGQYAMNHRSIRNGTPLDHTIPNIAREMRKGGYLPMLFGYTDTPRDPRIHHPADPAVRTYEYPLADFAEMTEMRLDESYPWRAHLKAKGYDLPDYADFYVPQGPALNAPAFYAAEDSDTAFLTDECLKALSVRTDQQWFAHLTYIRPHPPLVAPAPYNTLYDPAEMPDPVPAEQATLDHPFLEFSRADKTADDFVDGKTVAPDDAAAIRTLRAVYLGLATEVDHHIGRVMRFLKETGQYDDTLIVLCADHGEMLGDHASWGKATVFDAAFHTPLILRLPGSPSQGQRFDMPTESIDIMPTILDHVGLECPASVNGRSLMPLLNGEAAGNWRSATFSELDFGDPITPTAIQRQLGLETRQCNLSILREGDLTLVHFNAGLPPLLYDHARNGEAENLAADPAHAATLLRLTQRLLDHRMSHADTTLSNIMITGDGPVAGG
ncbi:sulfatase-like hydrolase/transferase [Rhodobacteraceae bacterium NNCM2]|nr:sulfatase-like hydrolase/transferase [Coraliihabitans acroporae]